MVLQTGRSPISAWNSVSFALGDPFPFLSRARVSLYNAKAVDPVRGDLRQGVCHPGELSGRKSPSRFLLPNLHWGWYLTLCCGASISFTLGRARCYRERRAVCHTRLADLLVTTNQDGTLSVQPLLLFLFRVFPSSSSYSRLPPPFLFPLSVFFPNGTETSPSLISFLFCSSLPLQSLPLLATLTKRAWNFPLISPHLPPSAA